MKISCLNISNPKLDRLANDFGEIKTSELMDKYYPNSIPTYEEFISNKVIKEELGIIPISKVKDEIWGDETKNALLEYRKSQNKTKQ